MREYHNLLSQVMNNDEYVWRCLNFKLVKFSLIKVGNYWAEYTNILPFMKLPKQVHIDILTLMTVAYQKSNSIPDVL